MIKDQPFRLNVNGGQHEFHLSPEAALALDAQGEGPGLFHLLSADGAAHHVELVEADYTARTYLLRVDGTQYLVHISDHYERLVEQLGLDSASGLLQNTVKAPMPGLVLSILVQAGQEVRKGDPLLILEAMKMENVLKAANDGVVKAIAVQPGAAVDKGQLLVEMEGMKPV